MGIRNYAEDVLLVSLPSQPHFGSELDQVTEIVCEGSNQNVIMDFSEVEILTSESICSLMILDKYLCASERQLIFFNTSEEIMHVFGRTGLSSIFTFAEDEQEAVEIARGAVCMCV